MGLLLGAAGLAIVLLRGVWERRGELALLRALGFRKGRLAWLVLAENLLLLLVGCSLPTDDPSTVHDLRILAISTTPPELQYPVQGTFQERQQRVQAV